MNREQLLRYYDGMIGMLACWDNNSIRACINKESGEAIEQIRELILNMNDTLNNGGNE